MGVESIIGYVLGLATGLVVMWLKTRDRPSGSINIDRSDPDGPYLFLELAGSISELSKKKRAMFKVKNRNYVSRK